MFINLKNKFVTAVADTYGGELISLKDKDGVEYLWGGDEVFWNGRSPHLFPIIGTLKNNETWIKGEKYSMLKHGFARNREYKVVESSESSVTFVLKDSLETKRVYPFRFYLYVTHSLLENGFCTSYKIVNGDTDKISFNIGGHVGVKCPIFKQDLFEEYDIVFDRPLTLKAYFPPSDNPIENEWLQPFLNKEEKFSLSYELFKEGPMILEKIKSHTLKMKNRKSGKGIEFKYEGFPVLALWTFGKKQAPYLCLEPWHGMPGMEGDSGKFEEKPYIITLEVGQEKVLEYSMQYMK